MTEQTPQIQRDIPIVEGVRNFATRVGIAGGLALATLLGAGVPEANAQYDYQQWLNNCVGAPTIYNGVYGCWQNPGVDSSYQNSSYQRDTSIERTRIFAIPGGTEIDTYRDRLSTQGSQGTANTQVRQGGYQPGPAINYPNQNYPYQQNYGSGSSRCDINGNGRVSGFERGVAAALGRNC